VCLLLCRYKGHVNSEFRIDSVVSSSDRHVLSGSEDGCVYVWHLVDVSYLLTFYLSLKHVMFVCWSVCLQNYRSSYGSIVVGFPAVL